MFGYIKSFFSSIPTPPPIPPPMPPPLPPLNHVSNSVRIPSRDIYELRVESGRFRPLAFKE